MKAKSVMIVRAYTLVRRFSPSEKKCTR